MALVGTSRDELEFEYRLEPISATLCDRPRVTIDGVMYEA